MRACSRRTFLVTSALALLGAARAAAGGGAPGRDAMAGLGRDVGALFGDPAAARRLGRRYLATHPNERRAVHLWARELAGARRPWGTADELRRAVAQRRERDLQDGVVAIVDGWVLARTEARVCALLAVLG